MAAPLPHAAGPVHKHKSLWLDPSTRSPARRRRKRQPARRGSARRRRRLRPKGGDSADAAANARGGEQAAMWCLEEDDNEGRGGEVKGKRGGGHVKIRAGRRIPIVRGSRAEGSGEVRWDRRGTAGRLLCWSPSFFIYLPANSFSFSFFFFSLSCRVCASSDGVISMVSVS